MISLRWKWLPVVLLFAANVFVGCGGGSGSGGGTTTPVNPQFTSTPVMGAEEGATYTYQVAASSPDKSAITYALSSGPAGATLAGNTVTWTPTHQESRVANAFTVTATTASGGSATQTWSVTPNGNINITDVLTYWGASGSSNAFRIWRPGALYPAALVPQSDGSLTRLGGAMSADGSFSIPNVPAGYVWLQLGPSGYFWITTSDFDFGEDIVGMPLAGSNSPATTTFNYSISGLQPAQTGDYITIQTLADGLSQLPFPSFLPNGATSVSESVPSPSFIDWSKVDTLFVSDYVMTSSGAFGGFTLGPTAMVTGLTLTDGATNNITATLSPSPAATVPLSIQGTQWASVASGIAPSNSAPSSSNYFLYAQPYLTDRLGARFFVSANGPGFTMLRPAPPPAPISFSGSNSCGNSAVSSGFPLPPNSLPPIVTDVDYGVLSYGDPFPAAWQRLLQYCQETQVSLPRPNSTVTDTFILADQQTTAVPAGPVTPILGPVQNPTINGASIFQTATVNTTSVNLSWNAPAIGQPYGYYVVVNQLGTLTNGGAVEYIPVGQFGTAKTSMQVPFLNAGNTYVFLITSATDGLANMEMNPLRRKAPNAEASVVSAPIVIATGATAAVKR
jgi:hypothetical protein